MRIILVRHAIAEDRDEARWPDAARPLSKRGRERFDPVARGLGVVAPEVDAVLSSPYARAWETAALLHALAGWPIPQASDALIATDPVAIGAALEAHTGTVALVGHEPGLSALASWLLCGPRTASALAFRKGGAACLEFERWAPGSAALRWFVPPKLLRLLSKGDAPPAADHLEAIAQPAQAAASTAASPAPTSNA